MLETIQEKLSAHRVWLDSHGERGQRFFLRKDAFLTMGDLPSMPLVLRGASIAKCTFYELDLSGCDLRAAFLKGCTFQRCNLAGIDLRGANLTYAHIREPIWCSKAAPVKLAGVSFHAGLITPVEIPPLSLDWGSFDWSRPSKRELKRVGCRPIAVNAMITGLVIPHYLLHHLPDNTRIYLSGSDRMGNYVEHKHRLRKIIIIPARP